jgi:uncharacterized protein
MAIAIMSKIIKQRKESIKSFQDAGRVESAAAEQEECNYILEYMPKQLSEEEIRAVIDNVITKVGATTVKDMGKVMAEVRKELAGKADISQVGDIIKSRLASK